MTILSDDRQTTGAGACSSSSNIRRRGHVSERLFGRHGCLAGLRSQHVGGEIPVRINAALLRSLALMQIRFDGIIRREVCYCIESMWGVVIDESVRSNMLIYLVQALGDNQAIPVRLAALDALSTVTEMSTFIESTFEPFLASTLRQCVQILTILSDLETKRSVLQDISTLLDVMSEYVSSRSLVVVGACIVTSY